MPDINPADLSRASVSLTTPILASKSITVSAAAAKPKTSQIIPPRIELESAYSALKTAIGPDHWVAYKDASTQFFIGRLNQREYSDIVDPILASPTGEKEHLHNQLIAAIYGNVTREMPDLGLAPWVSANDKPSGSLGSKPPSGDAKERRLKGEIMLLPSKDRRRIKDLAHNDFDPFDALSSVFADQHRSRTVPRAVADVPNNASGGINRMNLDLEIRKRYAQPLAVESGEFPDTSNIESRMLPFCYEAGLVSGHTAEAAQFMSTATETFIKEALSAIFSRTRSNGPGEIGSAGFGGNNWVQTRKYRRQLGREEESALRGETHRDKMGLLPIEAKAAGERGPLGLAELRIALEMGDCCMTQFPIIGHSLMYNYHEGELENWSDHTWIDGRDRITAWEAGGGGGAALTNGSFKGFLTHPQATLMNGSASAPGSSGPIPPGGSGGAAGAGGVGGTDTPGSGVGGVAMVKAASTSSLGGGSGTVSASAIDMKKSNSIGLPSLPSLPNLPSHPNLPNLPSMPNGGIEYSDPMDVDSGAEMWWEGADHHDGDLLDNVLDSCLAVG